MLTRALAKWQQEEEEKLEEGGRLSGATYRAVSDVTVHSKGSPSEY